MLLLGTAQESNEKKCKEVRIRRANCNHQQVQKLQDISTLNRIASVDLKLHYNFLLFNRLDMSNLWCSYQQKMQHQSRRRPGSQG